MLPVESNFGITALSRIIENVYEIGVIEACAVDYLDLSILIEIKLYYAAALCTVIS